MRIALDCRSVFPSRGGIGRYTQNLAQILPQIAPQNDYFLFATKKQKESIVENFPVKQIGFDAGMIDPYWEQMKLPEKLARHEIHLYHNPCFSLPIAQENTKLVATIHDIVFREEPQLVTPWLREYLDRWTEVSLKIADHIITVSDYSKQQILKYYDTDASKISVIYNGIEKHFQPASEAKQNKVREKYKIPKDFILYLGSVEPKKI